MHVCVLLMLGRGKTPDQVTTNVHNFFSLFPRYLEGPQIGNFDHYKDSNIFLFRVEPQKFL